MESQRGRRDLPDLQRGVIMMRCKRWWVELDAAVEAAEARRREMLEGNQNAKSKQPVNDARMPSAHRSRSGRDRQSPKPKRKEDKSRRSVAALALKTGVGRASMEKAPPLAPGPIDGRKRPDEATVKQARISRPDLRRRP